MRQFLIAITGLSLVGCSFALLFPTFVAYLYHEKGFVDFFAYMVLTFLTGVLLWWPFRQEELKTKTHSAFVITIYLWLFISILGALPFYFTSQLHLSLIQALFESISGITTTGATVLTNLDKLPKSLLFFRQELQFIGGMGVVLLALAILPMLGMSGLYLFKIESSGVLKDKKISPRVSDTAKILLSIYVGLNLACFLLLFLGGIPIFDAICYAFSIVSTGGFAPHDLNTAFYNSTFLKMVAVVFMVLGATSFTLHFELVKKKKWSYWQDEEWRYYVKGLIFLSLLSAFTMYVVRQEPSQFGQLLLDSIFQVVSFSTTTGLTTLNHASLPLGVPAILFFVAILGGCAGSTSGGIKIIRWLILYKISNKEIHQLVHPHANFSIKYNNKPLQSSALESVAGFFFLYIFLFVVFSTLLMYTGLDFYHAFTSVGAAMSCSGPGFGDYALNYATMSDTALSILNVAMLVGRLEIFTIMVLLSPYFWQK